MASGNSEVQISTAVRSVLSESRAEQLTDQALQQFELQVPSLDQIRKLESAMRATGLTSDLPVTHRFADGLYARELFMPAQSVVVGKMHGKSHFFVLLSGAITAWTPAGMKRFEAGEVFITVAGTKRAIYAHVDSRLITFHATELTEVDAIEDEIIVPESLEQQFVAHLEYQQ